MELPGYVESGQNYVPDHAEPFIYWDGLKVYRILEKPDDYQLGGYLICDFGSLAGLYTEVASEDIYRQIRLIRLMNLSTQRYPKARYGRLVIKAKNIRYSMPFTR